MLLAVLAIAGLAGLLGLLLGYSAIRFRVEGDPLADRIDAVLPQTQCGQCGYPGCRPYAEALARGEVGIDRCVPGGEATIVALGALLGQEPARPSAMAAQAAPVVLVARIDDQACIGCTLCLQACPVDAIVGAGKQLHGVLTSECTGCGLCLPPCPVDCIRLVPPGPPIARWRWPDPARGAVL